jgi:ABC-type multidrug transport system ATPase subunit
VNGAVDTIQSYSDLVGFVPQDDIMHSDLSVKENLYMYAKLRLPYHKTSAQVTNVVSDVMGILELDRISHSIIGDAEKRGISGGQRKRVNIAMELVGDPSLLFLDEPTSGLDSSTSYAVIGALKAISRKGSNVIVVLHQPSYQIYEMFDDVIFLARGGSTVYVGPASGAMTYFNNTGFTCPPLVNPAGSISLFSFFTSFFFK